VADEGDRRQRADDNVPTTTCRRQRADNVTDDKVTDDACDVTDDSGGSTIHDNDTHHSAIETARQP
jgi:hypothetical protein